MRNRRPASGPRSRRTLVACTASAALLMAFAPTGAQAASIGGGNAFSELTKSEAESTPTQTTGEQTSSSGGGSDTSSLLFAGSAVAIVLLGGIAFAIVRDARRVAPAAGAQLGDGRSRGDSAARMRRRRARAKAARQQRKRNR